MNKNKKEDMKELTDQLPTGFTLTKEGSDLYTVRFTIDTGRKCDTYPCNKWKKVVVQGSGPNSTISAALKRYKELTE